MAKKVTGYIKLQIPAGKATPAPPVGPALGQHGVNIVQFTKEFNARTADQYILLTVFIFLVCLNYRRKITLLLHKLLKSVSIICHIRLAEQIHKFLIMMD